MSKADEQFVALSIEEPNNINFTAPCLHGVPTSALSLSPWTHSKCCPRYMC